jgi:Yip1-like protein/zinc ribbon protein
MLCPKCNQPVLDNQRFCGTCGAAVDAGGGNNNQTLIRPPANPSAGSASSSAGSGAGYGGGAGYSGGASGGTPGGTPGGAPGGGGSWTSNATAQLPGLIQRVKNILLTPKTEWPVIESEPTSVSTLYTGYIMPLAALAALMQFLRMSVIGINIGFGTFRTPLVSGLIMAVVGFGFGLLGVFLFGFIIKALAPTFAGQGDHRQALKTAAYACTPAWIASVFTLLGALGGLLQLVAGIYGIYLLYLGLPILMRSPREKAGSYTAAVVVCGILLGILFAVLSAVTGGFGGYGGFGRYGGLNNTAMTREQQQEQAGAAVANVIGGALGTDDKGKAGLAAAITNLAAAGQKIEQQQQNAAASAGAPTPAAGMPPDAASTQNAMAATAGLMTALGGAMGGKHRVDPVDFHTLKGMLPDSLPGMQRTAAEGSSQQAMGVKGSSASANYQGPAGARAEIKITDASAVSGLLDVAGSMVQNRTSESDNGYEKDATVGGRLIHEKYDTRSKHGELNAIVAKRFMVDVTGDGVDMSTLEQYAGYVDFAKLEAMKDAGAQP